MPSFVNIIQVMQHKYNSYWDDPPMWTCLAIIMDPRYRLVNCMVLIDDIFSNMNKNNLIEEFNNKI